MDSIARRFRKVLDLVYGGNVGQMAHDIGVDRSTCSRYKDGKTKPNRRSLMALCHAQKISLEWLERGEEEDIQYMPESSSSDGISEWGLKVFRSPVLEVKEERQLGETGMLIATPCTFHSEKRYWLEIRQDILESAVRAGDHLLIEPCSAREPSDSDLRRLRIIVRDSDPTPTLVTVTDVVCKGKNKAKVVGVVLLLHRDMQG